MSEVKTKKRVGILRGGTDDHYKSSLKKGGEIILHISENLGDKYKTVDILIDKDHTWHLGGLPISPSDLPHRVDVVWNTTHPSFSNILDSLSIPNIGASSFSGALGSSREMLREHMKKIGISMPRSIVLPVYQKDFDGPREKYAIKKAKEVFEKFGSPWIVKSFTPDANMAVHLAKTFNELVSGIEDGVKHEKSILVEEFIAGKIAAVHSVVNFRGEDVYIFPFGNSLGNPLKLGEASFSLSEKEKLTNLARELHMHLGAQHYSKFDLILHSRGKVYLLDFELTPNLRPDSHFSQACESVGAKMHDVVGHILEQAV